MKKSDKVETVSVNEKPWFLLINIFLLIGNLEKTAFTLNGSILRFKTQLKIDYFGQ